MHTHARQAHPLPPFLPHTTAPAPPPLRPPCWTGPYRQECGALKRCRGECGVSWPRARPRARNAVKWACPRGRWTASPRGWVLACTGDTLFVVGGGSFGVKAAAGGGRRCHRRCTTTRATWPAFHFAIIFDSLCSWSSSGGVRQCVPEAVRVPQNSHKPQANERPRTRRSRKSGHSSDEEGDALVGHDGDSPFPAAPPLFPRLTATSGVPTCALEVLWRLAGQRRACDAFERCGMDGQGAAKNDTRPTLAAPPAPQLTPTRGEQRLFRRAWGGWLMRREAAGGGAACNWECLPGWLSPATAPHAPPPTHRPRASTRQARNEPEKRVAGVACRATDRGKGGRGRQRLRGRRGGGPPGKTHFSQPQKRQPCGCFLDGSGGARARSVPGGIPPASSWG